MEARKPAEEQVMNNAKLKANNKECNKRKKETRKNKKYKIEETRYEMVDDKPVSLYILNLIHRSENESCVV